MSEFSSRAAQKTPTSYSDDIVTPFVDIGMAGWSDEQIRDFFAGKTVLDIGSGFEGIARRLYGLFNNISDQPKVINLNPQFSDWKMEDTREGSFKKYKHEVIKEGIEEIIDLSGEDPTYLTNRLAIAGLVQQLPFLDNSIDVAISTWAFPTSFYDCFWSNNQHRAAYGEIQRVLRSGGGTALLAPVKAYELPHAQEMLSSILVDECRYSVMSQNREMGSASDWIIQITKF